MAQKLRILHTNFHHGWGGQTNRVLTVSQELKQRGHQLVIGCPRDSKLARRARSAPVEVHDDFFFARGLRLSKFLHDVQALRRLHRQHDFDIIHLHGSQDSWTAFAAFFFSRRKPVIIRTRHNFFPVRRHYLNRLLYCSFFDHIVCVSRLTRTDLEETFPFRPDAISTIHSAIDLDRIDSTLPKDLRKELSLEGKMLIGTAARLRPEKGLDVLLQAIPLVRERVPEAHFVLIGGGSQEGELRSLATKLQIEPYLHFLGFQENVPSLLKSLDLFVLPSRREGLGTALMEAAAVGIPVVATFCGGSEQVLTPERSALFVSPNDGSALAEAIIKMLSNAEQAQELARHARMEVEEKFTVPRLVSETESLYRTLCSQTTN